MSSTYTTISGDMWDEISKKVYGTESGMNTLLEANDKYHDTVIFSSGITLIVPDYTTSNANNLPPWRS